MKTLLTILLAASFFCVRANNTDSAKTKSFHVVLTVTQEHDALNDVLTAFNMVQKPDKMNIYYPASIPNAATVDARWEQMDKKWIDKIKKYCNKLKEKISVEYE